MPRFFEHSDRAQCHCCTQTVSRRQPATKHALAHCARPWGLKALRDIAKNGALVACFALSFHAPAQACAFDMVKPEKTIIDWIVTSETLVLARPMASNPFHYGITAVLSGSLPQDPAPIEQLVDSRTRAKLSANPDDTVLFARTDDGSWRRVLYMNAAVSDIVRVSLGQRDDWQTGMPQSRIAYLEELQQNADPFHQNLVIRELDKVPYAQLRTFNLDIPVHRLRAGLWTIEGYPYQAIQALLLGLSGTDEAREEIVSFVERVHDWPWAENLGAFSAALIELDGVAAVDRLSRNMLMDRAQPLDKLEQIIMALSVHYELADSTLQEAIADAIQDFIAQRPEAGVLVARQFTLRSDWSQSEVLEPLVRERKLNSLADLLTVSAYVARAREYTKETRDDMQ